MGCRTGLLNHSIRTTEHIYRDASMDEMNRSSDLSASGPQTMGSLSFLGGADEANFSFIRQSLAKDRVGGR